MTSESKKEFTLRISQANPSEMIVITYEIALSYLDDAKCALKDERWDELKSAVSHTQKCISTLMEALDFKQDIAMRLMELYAYADRELTKVNTKREEEYLLHAEHVFTDLLSAFQEVCKEDTRKPMMENSQMVYAGLTYGKNDLNESIADDYSSRGFRA